MPKIIENLESKLIAQAKKQIEESGYGAMTIRSVAKACGVGVGTVYNYFPSKEYLLATFLLGDWSDIISVIQTVSDGSASPLPVLRCIYDQLSLYTLRHQAIFRDESALAAVAASYTRFHEVLRSQLAVPLQKFCSSEFEAEFLVEALLTWTISGKTFDEIYGMIGRLL